MSKPKPKLIYVQYVYYNFIDDEVFATIIPPHFFTLRAQASWAIYLGEL